MDNNLFQFINRIHIIFYYHQNYIIFITQIDQTYHENRKVNVFFGKMLTVFNDLYN